jgi:mannose-6-phosphate isomerase-like protein (cupin superfamily)
MQYKYTADEATKVNKHGIDLTIYGMDCPTANVVHVEVQKGHFQEFYNVESTFIYYIYEGRGTFVLNDEPVEAAATDLIVIPPNTRIYYFGTMKMVLTTTPRYKEENELHVRFVDESESPYANTDKS